MRQQRRCHKPFCLLKLANIVGLRNQIGGRRSAHASSQTDFRLQLRVMANKRVRRYLPGSGCFTHGPVP